MKSLIALFISLSGMALGQIRAVIPANEPAGGNLPIQRIGPNDLLAVSVYDAPELTRTVRVAEDGSIRLPMLKEHIQAQGRVPAELETIIGEALKQEKMIVDPYVTVTIAEYYSRPVSVIGAVRRPITFQAAGTVTLLDALARAEGLTQEAGTEILLKRPVASDGGRKAIVQRISVRGLMDATDPESNIKLTGGEEILVPEAGRVFIVGNVKKPGAFVVRDSGEATVLKALAFSEGLLPYSGKLAYIYRREASGNKNELPVELQRLMARKAADIPLMAGDILYVPAATGARLGVAALEKLILFGSGASTALIYAGVR